MEEEERATPHFRVLHNDSTRASLILLTGLKNVICAQLPKMPPEYVERLVFDRFHWNIAILNAPDPAPTNDAIGAGDVPIPAVIGGINFRPFFDRQFAEVVFFCVKSEYQSQGLGRSLMNHFKDFLVRQTTIRHFLTCADLMAIPYFEKQGLTNEITLEPQLWHRYIKYYDYVELMQCSLLPRVDYVRVREQVAQQKQAVIRKMQGVSNLHVRYPGVADMGSEGKMDPSTLPGMEGLRYEQTPLEKENVSEGGQLYTLMKTLLDGLTNHPSSEIFRYSVDPNDVPDYHNIIACPVDLSKMRERLQNGVYRSLEAFKADFDLLLTNCFTYNSKDTKFYGYGEDLGSFFKDELRRLGVRTEEGTDTDPGRMVHHPELAQAPASALAQKGLTILSGADGADDEAVVPVVVALEPPAPSSAKARRDPRRRDAKSRHRKDGKKNRKKRKLESDDDSE